jgi:predicted Zn-dependent peptidase
MKTMKKHIILGVALLAAGTSFGQLDRSVQPKAGTPPTINIKDSEVFTTENGITVILSENHKLPKVSIRLVTGSDPIQEGPKAGLSSIAGQLIMSGTANRTKDKLDAEIDYIGASLSADATSISLSCLTKHMDKGLDLMTDVLYNTNFPQSEFDRIKKQNESGLLSAKSSPDQMADNVEKKTNFPNGHPYGEIMTEATLSAITKSDVENYYKKVFTPDGSYLVIVGDVTKEKAREIANKYFALWKGGKKYEANLGAGKFNKGNRVIFVKKPGAVQSVVTVTFPVDIKTGHENQLPLTVLNGILGGGGFGTRLMQNLREDKAYTYGCYSSLNITENGSWLAASGNFRNEVTDSAITQILFELDRITTEYVKDEELNLTKSAMAGGFARSLESPSTVARFALNIIQNKLPKAYYQTYLKRLEAIDKEAVLLMAQTYFTAKNCNIIVVGNEEILEKLKQFDADGKIELVDAFGDEVKEMKPSDITKEQLFEKYIFAKTGTTSMKAANKKIKKIKSVKQVIELSAQQIPAPLTMTTYFVAPNKESMKLEMSGMMIQKEFFDGEKGASMNMQTGKKEMTAEEIAEKKKTSALIPEMNYAANGMVTELLGIENQNGTEMYVLKIVEGENTSFDYFDVKTFQKLKTVSIAKNEGETIETSRTYSDYKAVNGVLFPYKTTIMMGEMGLNGEVKTIEINGKVDAMAFE